MIVGGEVSLILVRNIETSVSMARSSGFNLRPNMARPLLPRDHLARLGRKPNEQRDSGGSLRLASRRSPKQNKTGPAATQNLVQLAGSSHGLRTQPRVPQVVRKLIAKDGVRFKECE